MVDVEGQLGLRRRADHWKARPDGSPHRSPEILDLHGAHVLHHGGDALVQEPKVERRYRSVSRPTTWWPASMSMGAIPCLCSLGFP